MLQLILDILLGLKIKSTLIENKKHDSMYVDSEGLSWPNNSLVPSDETLEEKSSEIIHHEKSCETSKKPE